MYKISSDRWENTEHHLKKVDELGQKWLLFENVVPPYMSWEQVEIGEVETSPIKGVLASKKPWEGSWKVKPWDYKVTAVIPCLRTPEILQICVELLQLQSVKPYIIILDTGSLDADREQIEALRGPNVEVHLLRFNGVRHPSDYPAMAMDAAFSFCRTEFLFATHADCYLRKQTFLEELLQLCPQKSSVVGYQLSPRNHKDWVGMVSHTATMFHMPTMDDIGFAWSLRRLCNSYGIVDYSPIPTRPNWPDTEILGNYILRKNKIEPHLIGEEQNNSRTLDENIDHFRSFTAGKLYSPGYYQEVEKVYFQAKKEALERIERWKSKKI